LNDPAGKKERGPEGFFFLGEKEGFRCPNFWKKFWCLLCGIMEKESRTYRGKEEKIDLIKERIILFLGPR